MPRLPLSHAGSYIRVHCCSFMKDTLFNIFEGEGYPTAVFLLALREKDVLPKLHCLCACVMVSCLLIVRRTMKYRIMEENDYTFLIPFHSFQLITSTSMFSSVLDASPHQFYTISISSDL